MGPERVAHVIGGVIKYGQRWGVLFTRLFRPLATTNCKTRVTDT